MTALATAPLLGWGCAARSGTDALAEFDRRLQTGTWDDFATHLGPAPEPTWRRIFDLARQGDGLEFAIVPATDVVPPTGTFRAHLCHRFVDADPGRVSETIECRTAGGRVVEARFHAGDREAVWHHDDVVHLVTDHTHLLGFAAERSALLARAGEIDAGVAAARAEVVGHVAPERTVLFFGTGEVPPLLFGRGISFNGGLTRTVDTTGGPTHRLQLHVAPDEQRSVAPIAAHETIHHLTFSWGPGQGTRFVDEGLAVWGSLGHMAGILAELQRVPIPREVARSAVDSRFIFPTDAPLVYTYSLGASFFAWLEARVGIPATWAAARRVYETGVVDHLALAAGHPTLGPALGEWCEWVTPHLAP